MGASGVQGMMWKGASQDNSNNTCESPRYSVVFGNCKHLGMARVTTVLTLNLKESINLGLCVSILLCTKARTEWVPNAR